MLIGYAIGALSLILYCLGFSYLGSGLDAWLRDCGFRDLLISQLLMALGLGLAYCAAVMVIVPTPAQPK